MNRSELSMQTVGVVVCTHLAERLPLVAASVGSLQAQTRLADELVVMVDGTPDLAAQVSAHLPGVRVECTGANQGVSVARNRAAACLHTDIVVFLDDDATAEPDLLANLVTPMSTDERVLGVSGRSLPRFETPPPPWFPEEFLWTVGCAYRGMPEVLRQVRNFQGGCAAVRRDRFLALDGFSSSLGYSSGLIGGGEEADFCLRAQEDDPGVVFLYAPDAVAYHRVPAQRLTYSYFWRRCFDEGMLKQRLSARRPGSSLGEERSFAMAMPLVVLRSLVTPGEQQMALGIVIGVLAVLSGMLRGRIRS